MGESMRDGISSSGQCTFCGATIDIAFYLKRGELIYCEECGEAYILVSRYPPRLQLTKERQMGTPWLDGSYFI